MLRKIERTQNCYSQIPPQVLLSLNPPLGSAALSLLTANVNLGNAHQNVSKMNVICCHTRENEKKHQQYEEVVVIFKLVILSIIGEDFQFMRIVFVCLFSKSC